MKKRKTGMPKKVITKAEYKRRAAKAVATKAANKLKSTDCLGSIKLGNTKEMVEKINKKITISNAKFNKMSKANKRIAIAKDILTQLMKRVYKATPGTYTLFRTKENVSEFGGSYNEDKDLQANFEKDIENCDTCALGACILSIARLGDSLTFADVDNRNAKATKKIKSIFEPNQLALIETAFEKTYDNFGFWSTQESGTSLWSTSVKIGGQLTTEQADAAVSFGRRYSSDKSRLIAIYQNIIDNKGTFKP